MVQRAEARELARQDAQVIQDPMLARNRSLSAFAVLLLIALIGVLVLDEGQDSGLGGGGNFSFIPTNLPGENPVIEIPTGSPTVTPPIPILSDVRGTLAFTVRQNGQDDIWALPVGSSQPVRLTDSLADDRDPAWSPDGGKIVFASRRDGPWDLYVLDLTQGQTTRLTFTQDYEGGPTWSPDGQFIAFEGYTEEAGNIDIYIMSADGQEGPFPFTRSPLPDLNPDWSPGGRDIAYVGWRNGSPDILVLNLDGQPEAEARNVTNSPNVQENDPAWSPEGSRIAYTANDQGIVGVQVRNITSSDPAQLIGRGQMVAWNPLDGSSVFYTVPQAGQSALYLGQVDTFGVGANAISFQGQVSGVDWTLSQHSLTGFDPRTPPLFEEDITELPDGKIGLALLNDVDAPDPVLSDAVNDSYEMMRRRVLERVGYDLLGTLESAFWRRERLPEPGQERTSWHYTGRAIALDRDLVFAGNPTPLVAIREENEVGTFWRVMARVAENAQNGELGEPLRAIPWDFASRIDDPSAFEEGGRPMDSVPPGYYVDVTRLFADFGWQRVQADRTWRSNFSGVLFWQFQKPDGLSWEQSMLQLYTQGEIDEFLRGDVNLPTPIPTATGTIDPNITDIPPTAIPVDQGPRTPTPVPPDQADQ
jgi:TolB protein